MENFEEKKQQQQIEQQQQEEEELKQETPSAETPTEGDATGELQETDKEPTSDKEVEAGEGEGAESGEEISEESEPEKKGEDESVKTKEEETPSDTEEENTSSVQEEENKTEENLTDSGDTPLDEVSELKTKLAELEYEKTMNDAITSYKETVAKNTKELEEFREAMNARIVDECKRYGVPTDMDFQTMKEQAPDKFNILQNILSKAEQVKDDILAKVKADEVAMGQQIIFAAAENEMNKYGLEGDTLQEACNTFVRILHEVGVKDLRDDLAAKVELAVARAKMISGDIKDVVKESKDVVDAVKETVKDTVEAVKEVKEVTKKSLDEFKESASIGETSAAQEVSKGNVMEIYASLPPDERLEFYQKHMGLINEIMTQRGGIPYSK